MNLISNQLSSWEMLMHSECLTASLVKMVMELSKVISDSKTKINEYQNFFKLCLMNNEKLETISEFMNNLRSSCGLLYP